MQPTAETIDGRIVAEADMPGTSETVQVGQPILPTGARGNRRALRLHGGQDRRGGGQGSDVERLVSYSAEDGTPCARRGD